MKKSKDHRWPSYTTTDQEYCYDNKGQVIPCTGTGQDASFPKTQKWAPAGRFSVTGQVIEDRLTQAIWSRDANPAGFPQTWHEALQTVATMREQRMHGYGDWQLPSRDLLFSLISHQSVNPAVAAMHPFENIFTGYYWTRDSCCRLPDQAWYIHMGGGRIHKGMKHGSYLVWPVCPGPVHARDAAEDRLNRFTIDADGVYDKHTGLIWFADADPIGRPLSWEAALAAVRTFGGDHAATRSAWRMPNIRELESLAALESHSPALSSGHPFVNVRDAYWSSTTSVYEPRYAWTLYSQDGYVGVGYKPQEAFYLWPVRSP